ncbi:MAG: ATP synthase F1 subunit epsilon [Planctomycetes bacterium]|nr:ATP synthase F1 subunit epsilon [Planctomycetota bacterium]
MSAGKLSLSILTPEKPIFQGEVDFVVLPLHDGELGAYPLHAPLLGKLGQGELRAKAGETWHRYYVGRGFAEIADDVVTVLSDEAMLLSELDPEATLSELEEARSRHARTAEEIDSRLADMDRAKVRRRLAIRK